MTENKRFVEIENEWVKDTETGDEWEYAIECISTLNQLSDIATNLGDFRSFITEDMQKTKEENKQLKKDIEFSDRKQNDFFKNWNDCMNENFRLKQENEQLKEKNKQLRHDLNVLRRGVFGGF